MNDPFGHLARLQRELGNIASQLTQVHFTFLNAPGYWRPAINAYRCGERFIICVELAGVDRSAVRVLAEPRRLTIHGKRTPPEPPCNPPQPVQVLEMGIDYGPFERVLELPAEVDPNRVSAEQRDGLLWVDLPLRDL
jgi:HSP20 family protein